MSKPVPKVMDFMTTNPHTVRVDMTLTEASALMREHQFRHLPVLRAGSLVGMLSQRDIHLIETLKDVDPNLVVVEDAMSPEVFEVAPDANLDVVAATMAEHKYGSAVVVDNGRVVGIFTNVDALNALAELLNTRLAT